MRSLFSSRKESNQDAVDGRQLTLPAELEDGRVPNVLTNFSYLASGLILVSLVWASIAEIREFAVAHGKIIPTGDVRQVHHLEGGQIEKLLVSEGQFVNKGTPMLSLRPQAAESDLGQLNVRRAHLAMKEIRLSALLDGEKPDFSASPKRKRRYLRKPDLNSIMKGQHYSPGSPSLSPRTSPSSGN